MLNGKATIILLIAGLYCQRDRDTKTLLVTCRCSKLLPLIRILQQSFRVQYPSPAFFQLTNLTITILSWLLPFLERESVTSLSISGCDIYSRFFTDVNHGILWIFIRVLFGMPDGPTLFLRLYYSHFAWYFSEFIIFSSNMLFTFWVIINSLLSFLFSIEIWSIVFISLDIWPDSLCKSASAITFSFRSNIFWLILTYWVNLMLILKDLKYWHYFQPFWLDLLMCQHRETMNLKFIENFVGLRVYPTDV